MFRLGFTLAVTFQLLSATAASASDLPLHLECVVQLTTTEHGKERGSTETISIEAKDLFGGYEITGHGLTAEFTFIAWPAGLDPESKAGVLVTINEISGWGPKLSAATEWTSTYQDLHIDRHTGRMRYHILTTANATHERLEEIVAAGPCERIDENKRKF